MDPREDDPEFAERRPTFDDLRADYDDEFSHRWTPFEIARRRVLGPAIAFIVTGSIGALRMLGLALYWIIELVVNGHHHGLDEHIIVGVMLFFIVLGMALFSLVAAGGVDMMRLRRRRLALFAAYVVTGLSLVPFYSIVFYPFGIWGLVVLYRPDVREQFGRRPTPKDGKGDE